MDGVMLLREARRAGLSVTTDGSRVLVRGPRRLEPVAQRLLAAKPAVLRVLLDEDEIAWRIEAMRRQVPADGPVPLLIARTDVPRPIGSCCSCGDALGPGDRYRCGPCVAAVVVALGTAR